jgi:kynurenine formamidase
MSVKRQPASMETPIGPRWWPSRWGADDERGAANHMGPAATLAAARLIREGRVLELGRVYQCEMPNFPHRSFRYGIPMPQAVEGENRRVGREDFFAGTLGQVGTQLDGLGHIGVRLDDGDTFYNGIKAAEMDDPAGLRRLGVEHVGVFFARGVLIDAAAAQGVERLPSGFRITPALLESALARQRLTLTPGDAVLIRTGHGGLWLVDNEAYNAGEPGIDLDAARWLVERDPCLVGADNWGIEVHPPVDPARPIEVHQHLITRHGIYFLENLELDALAGAGVGEFAFVFAPMKMKGGVGSPGNPIAVV